MTRLWIDANVILRFLTGDPEDLAHRAARLMAQAENGEVTLFITSMVLAEVIWVLKSFYRYPMTDIATTILAFLSAEGIETEERDLIIQAIELSHDRNVDFIHAYIAVQAARHGEKICTFDATHFKRLPVVWLSPE